MLAGFYAYTLILGHCQLCLAYYEPEHNRKKYQLRSHIV